MTKSGRHKKFRKQEKAKTQLTGVKKLKKAQNVVEPTLRVKKILIREQLKAGSISSGSNLLSSQPSPSSFGGSVDNESTETGYTKRKQNVQELLSSANHHNINIRKDALLGLQEIASSQINTVIRNLDKILTKIASLTSDQERVVRKENLKLAELIISKVNENQLRPFWSLLIAHLKCTMTHLIPSVRFSALPFLTMLMEHHPTLVSESSSIMLPNILGLISTSSKDNSSQSSVARLKVEITGKQHDLAARLNVLRLLSKCLLVSHSQNIIDTNSSKTDTSINASKSEYLALTSPFGYCWDQVDENEVKSRFRINGGCDVVKSYSDRFYSTIAADPFSSPFVTDQAKPSSNFWVDFTKTCVPVLIETWIESGPFSEESAGYRDKKGARSKSKQSYNHSQLGSEMNFNGGRRNGLHILNESAVESLLCVSSLLADLVFRNEQNVLPDSSNNEMVKCLRKLHEQALEKYFFSLMPYVSLQENRKADVISANLKLFLVAGELKMFSREMKKKLQAFIEEMMESSKLESEQCECILNIIKYLDIESGRDLSSAFLLHVTRLGYSETVAFFLNRMICPTNQTLPKSTSDFISFLKWDVIVQEVLRNWSKRKNLTDDHKELMNLLTYVALRRLIDTKPVLVDNLSIFDGFIEISKDPGLRDAVFRVFFYSDAEDIFRNQLMTEIS